VRPKKKLEAWLKDKPKPIGLYVTENYLDPYGYMYYRGLYSDRQLYRTQKKFIDYFNASGIFVIWKLHPAPPYPPHNTNYNIYKIKNELTFTSLVPYADFILIDHAGTVPLQAMAMASKPIFICLRYGIMTEAAVNLLRKSCVCYYDEVELIKAVEYFLSTGLYGADPENKEYLTAYGGV